MYNVPSNLQFSRGRVYDKPEGFWVSVNGDNDWPTWCISNEYNIGNLAVCHNIEIDLSRILIIDTENKLEAFYNAYRSGGYGSFWIVWPRVAREYDGIIITPYFYKYRLLYEWYYTWDCASGCLWNAKDVVKSITISEYINFGDSAKKRGSQ
jgi:hypothetical protein